MGSECVSEISEPEIRPHVVIVSIPPPGHMLPSIELAQELLSHGIQVTCFSTGRNVQSLHEKLEGTCKKGIRINFRALVKDSEFVPPAGQVQDNLAYMQSLSDEAIGVRLEEHMRTLTPPPCCIISDFLNGWSQDVANKFHIPRHVFFTMSANVLLFILSIHPSMASLAEASPQPPGIWTAMVDKKHPFHDYYARNIRRLPEACVILINTFEKLEHKFLDLVRTEMSKETLQWQEVLAVGPLISTSKSSKPPGAPQEIETRAQIRQWLDTQEHSSVLYVSFGSLLTLTENNIRELALGLEACGQPFVWVFRPPNVPHIIVTDDLSSTGLPAGFEERVSGRGLVIRDWAPQQEILAHSSVGGFLCHCGWNSTLEAISAGVPLITWPGFADQRLTNRFLVDDLRVGMEVHRDESGHVESAEVVRVVENLMRTEEGQSMKARMQRLKMLAHMAVQEDKAGPSMTSMQTFVQKFTEIRTTSTPSTTESGLIFAPVTSHLTGSHRHLLHPSRQKTEDQDLQPIT